MSSTTRFPKIPKDQITPLVAELLELIQLQMEEIHELGVNISTGQINIIIIKNKDRFHDEKDQILSTGLKVSSYINVDDTGARHDGQNGYCTHIGNEHFAWFKSTDSKSRINFLNLLRCEYTNFVLNDQAFEYMAKQKLPPLYELMETQLV